jgi:gluconate 2-dehydrogenase gamma chain
MASHLRSRREVLQDAALVAAAVLASCGRCSRPDAKRARVLDERESSALRAACSRLVPSDDGPGAIEAGVLDYLDAQLALPSFAVFRRELKAGVNALDLVAVSRFGAPFAALPAGGQDQVLARVQAGDGSGEDFDASHFFDVLLTFTLEGMFSDPVHGGNRQRVGWALIGLGPHGGTHGHE